MATDGDNGELIYESIMKSIGPSLCEVQLSRAADNFGTSGLGKKRGTKRLRPPPAKSDVVTHGSKKPLLGNETPAGAETVSLHETPSPPSSRLRKRSNMSTAIDLTACLHRMIKLVLNAFELLMLSVSAVLKEESAL